METVAKLHLQRQCFLLPERLIDWERWMKVPQQWIMRMKKLVAIFLLTRVFTTTSGINMRTRPTNNAIKRTIVVTTANVFLNFSLDFIKM